MGSAALDERILRLLALYPEGLKWSRIRNALLQQLNPPNLKTFNVQVSRSLKRLYRQKIIEKEDKGHKEVFYRLKDQSLAEFFNELPVTPLLLGKFNVDRKTPPSYEKWKRALFESLEEALNLKEEYKKFRAEWEEMKEQRENWES